MAYNDDSIELFQQQQNAIEEAQRRLQQEQEIQETSTPLPERVEREQQEVRARSGRGAGRAAFSTREQREARRAQQEQMATEEAARQEAEGDPTAPDRPEGWITQLGNALQGALDVPANVASDLTGGLIPSADEQRQNFMDSGQVGAAIVGGGAGIEAGALSPLTIAGRAANQATPWSDRPEIIKDNELAENLFTIMEVLTPSLVVGMAAPGLSAAPAFIAAESGLETAVSVETVDDVMGGRNAARAFGEVATRLGFDGEELTMELIRGETTRSHAFTATIGFLQNLGINVTAGNVMRAFSGTKPVYHGTLSPDEVRAQGFIVGTNPDHSGALGQGVYITGDKTYADFFAGQSGDTLAGQQGSQRIKEFRSADKFFDWITRNLPQDVLDRYEQTNLFPPDFSFQPYFPNYDGLSVEGLSIPSLSSTGRPGREVVIFEPSKANEIFNIRPTRAPLPNEERAAESLAMSSDEVAERVDDVQQTAYRPDEEPTESLQLDDGVSKPSSGNESVSTEGLAAEVLRDAPTPERVYSPRQGYFSNIKAVSDSKAVQRVIDEATFSIERLLPASANRELVAMRVGQWWEANRYLLDTDLNEFTRRYAMDMIRPLDDMMTGKPIKVDLFPQGAADTAPFDVVERVLRDDSMADMDGLVSGVVVLDELGQRAKDTAKQAVALNIQTNPIDYTASVERLLDMNDKIQMFAAPVRKGKRHSSDLMGVQQRGFIDRVFNRDESDAFGSDVFGIRMTDEDVARAPREFWEAAKAGDKDAQKTFDTWVNLIAGSDPSTASSDLLTLNYVMRQAARKGKSDGWRNLRYAMMLSSTKTHSLALWGNATNIVANPVGAYLSGDVRYANGQMLGTVANLHSAIQRFGYAWQNYSTIQGAGRVDGVARDLARNQQAMDDSFQMTMRQLNADGADPATKFGAWLSHNIATLGNQSWVSTFHRSLFSIDAMADTVIGSQIAHGRALVDAAQPGAAPVKDLIDFHMDHVFRDGIMNGTTPKDIKGAIQWATYSRDIPGKKGNQLDQLFDITNKASRDNVFVNIATPFTRMGWNYLDRFVATDPTLGRTLRQFVPRYRNILNGKEGEAMKMTLRHGIALGNTIGVLGTISGFMGTSTGFTSEKDKGSLIIPADNAQGYKAIPIWQLGHLGGIFSIYSDLGRLLRDEVITLGHYERAVGLMAFSFAMSSLDQSFTSSINNTLGMLNPRNFGYGTLRQVAGLGGMNVSPAAVRQVLGYAQPYEVNTRVQDAPVTTVINYLRQSLFGPIGLDTRYDELSGEAIPRSDALGSGQNYWAAVGSAIFSDTVYPGDIKPTGDAGGFKLPGARTEFSGWSSPTDAKQLRALLNTLGFSHDRSSSLRTYGGTPLSTAQQSIVQRQMGETGALSNRLVRYFDSDQFRSTWSRFLDARANGQDYKQHLELIHSDIRGVYREAKDFIVPTALRDDPAYQRARMSTRGEQVNLKQKPSPVDSLYAYGDGQLGIMDVDFEGLLN